MATQSKFLAVGSAVPWAQASAGAVATQSFANTAFGPNGRGMMASGLSAQEALELIPIDRKVTRELQRIAKRSGRYRGRLTGAYDAATQKAIETLVGMENLEERWQSAAMIDPIVLAFLQKAYPANKR